MKNEYLIILPWFLTVIAILVAVYCFLKSKKLAHWGVEQPNKSASSNRELSKESIVRIQDRNLCLKSILESLPYVISFVNKEGWVQSWEISPDQQNPILNTRSQSRLHVSEIVADACLDNALKAIQQVIENGGIIDVEDRILPMEPARWYESRLVRISENEAMVFSHEITQRKLYEGKVGESEIMFRSLFDMGNIAMGVLESDLSFSLINTNLKHLLGFVTDQQEFVNWSNIIIPEDIDYDKMVFQKLERGVIKSYQSEKRLIKSDGSTVFTHFTLFLLKNEYLQTFKFIVSFIDISDRMELERKVLNTMIDTEEKERVRISRELHDGVGPLLSSLKMYMQWMQMKDSKSNKEELMADAEVLIDQTLQTIRDISFNLSPHLLQNYGLVVALDSFIGKVQGVGNVEILLNTHGVDGRLGDEVEVILYRAITECINNTLKYAGASVVTIDVSVNNGLLTVVYKDNGVGFDADEVLNRKTGMGLFNMLSRLKAVNGVVHFNSQKGKGCHIEIEINI